MSKRIEIIVTPEGETTVSTRGFLGTSCREASAFIEKALGERTGERFTAEFHQEQAARTQVRHERT